MKCKNLDPENTMEWPFSMILNRLVTKFLSFFFPNKHTVVSAVTAAVPFFPLLIERFLQIPRTINGISV